MYAMKIKSEHQQKSTGWFSSSFKGQKVERFPFAVGETLLTHPVMSCSGGCNSYDWNNLSIGEYSCHGRLVPDRSSLPR